MIKILISEHIRETIPEIRLGCIKAVVEVRPSSEDLLNHIEGVCNSIRHQMQVEDVSKIEVISATKNAYRRMGKDPSRYRPSAEALTRRVVKGNGLYRVNNIVDTLNVISIKHGFSIGGYDLDRINEKIMLGMGQHNEPYEAIGRGQLNIENLPVLRDLTGAFGSPTSDSLRTMIKEQSRNFLMVFFDFSGSHKLQEALDDAECHYRDYCGVNDMESMISK